MSPFSQVPLVALYSLYLFIGVMVVVVFTICFDIPPVIRKVVAVLAVSVAFGLVTRFIIHIDAFPDMVMVALGVGFFCWVHTMTWARSL